MGKGKIRVKGAAIGVIYILHAHCSDNVPRIEQIQPREALLALVQKLYELALDGKQAPGVRLLEHIGQTHSCAKDHPHSDRRNCELCD